MALITAKDGPIIPAHKGVQSGSGGLYVYLAYIDDSNQKRGKEQLQVLAAVILDDSNFRNVEIMSAAHVMDLIPEERIDSFKEFHATELYNGHGAFNGIDQEKRFELIHEILTELKEADVPIIYGAVDVTKLRDGLLGSAEPADVAFRVCAAGVNKWIENNDPQQIAVLIADDSDKKTKEHLLNSFRHLRERFRPPEFSFGILNNIHDGMYFGSSTDSIGLQMADLCAYFIGRHLRGDTETEGQYSIIKDQVFYSERVPENEAAT